ncbi:MAG: hypothetical protein V4721_17960 [Bacteroidota bacterium]
MASITLVRHPLRFYLVQFISFILICGIGCGIASRGVLKINSGTLLHRADYVALAIGIVFVSLAFYMTFRYFRNTPAITADESSIHFGKGEVYALDDIQEIQLTGKVPLSVLWSYPVEGICLILKDGTKKFIYEDFYSNSWELKSFLEQVVVNKTPYVEYVPEINTNSIDIADCEVFKGHPVFSFRGIMLWGFIGFIIFLNVLGSGHSDPRIYFTEIGLSIIWFLAMSNSMNYFELSDEHFIVKNHYFFWKKHTYRIKYIKEIVFDTQPKAPIGLRLITTNFKARQYAAGTLKDSHWLDLMNALQQKGVIVRNECVAVS